MALIIVRVLIFLAVLALLYSIGFFPLVLRLARKTNVFKQNLKEVEKELNDGKT